MIALIVLSVVSLWIVGLQVVDSRGELLDVTMFLVVWWVMAFCAFCATFPYPV